MPDYVTDTHALIWYLEDSPRLGTNASQIFTACEQGELVIWVPTICLVEIIYLQERNRISLELKERFLAELQAGNSGLVLADLTAEVIEAVEQVPRDVVPDMPDRIIVATALSLNLPLITRDARIRMADVNTVW
ncbi:MAG TPA: PIN domain nuclease [Cyanobacteria bacterium UBA11369]|nr:PIN domain nuclease [Cyanobacteria bacterium UBA11371]HBE36323.1 PIN domain nuclease [Cyanobacteria bacterium UBA11368]HBE47262.1 PIN domain nuclease [Cyanobacteria bacterium UBA11369]